ncbi:peptidoglycan-recognition protein SB2 isoform X6 [Halyomorpha halys]|uniref:peptidoglycan-recognition protein SB2 isoform X6 n=1 Tax=Halyomorpha halys TaxID=286706 RepID=UPI0034D23787
MAVSTEYKCKVVTDKKGNVNVLISYVQKNDSVVLEDWTQKLLKYKYVWLSLILAVVVTTVLCIMLIPQSHAKNNSEDMPFSLNYTLKLRTRHNWSLRTELKDCEPLKIRPAEFVMVGHTVSRTCEIPDQCEDIMTSTQSDHIRKGYCDIGYSFVIGGDGYIYEGRGWGKSGAHTYGFNCNSIGVGLIGDFNKNIPTSDMLDMLQLLIEEGVRIREISQQYKLVFQSQVDQRASPGTNVEKVLKNWDHWSNLTAEDRIGCSNKKTITVT